MSGSISSNRHYLYLYLYIYIYIYICYIDIDGYSKLKGSSKDLSECQSRRSGAPLVLTPPQTWTQDLATTCCHHRSMSRDRGWCRWQPTWCREHRERTSRGRGQTWSSLYIVVGDDFNPYLCNCYWYLINHLSHLIHDAHEVHYPWDLWY